MSIFITRVADMFERVDRFLVERAIIPAIAQIAAAHAVLLAVLAEIRAAGERQIAGHGDYTGGVDTRVSVRADLQDLLRHINRTGRMLDADHPGIAGIFRLPRSGSAAQLLAAAAAIEAKATELEADFIACGLPASFLTELANLIDAYRDATTLKHDGRILRGGSTAELKAKASAGIVAAKALDICVRNHFRGNAEALGAWNVARHLERPNPTPPTSGEESTTTSTITIG